MNLHFPVWSLTATSAAMVGLDFSILAATFAMIAANPFLFRTILSLLQLEAREFDEIPSARFLVNVLMIAALILTLLAIGAFRMAFA